MISAKSLKNVWKILKYLKLPELKLMFKVEKKLLFSALFLNFMAIV